MTAPYWEDPEHGLAIYCGDAREVLPWIEHYDTCITDPVWPNSEKTFPGISDPAGMFRDVVTELQVDRLVVHMGVTSDPRFLAGVPDRLPFFRAVWLRYARPNYRGRVLISSDVAYVFGTPPPSRPGARALPGESVATSNGMRVHSDHPCPRHFDHVAHLVGFYAPAGVIDPFCGIGTTLVAAKVLGLPATGIEIEEKWCAEAAQRLDSIT